MSIKGFEVGGVQAKYDYESLDNIPANLVQDANYVHTDNNYTNADKTKLSGIEAQANKTTIDATLTHSGQAADAKATGDAISALNAQVIASMPHDTASGSIANFPDGAAMPVRDLSVDIEPVQAGSGDPSPENVRPISGHTDADVTRTGKNLLDPSASRIADRQSFVQGGVTVTYNADGSYRLQAETSTREDIGVYQVGNNFPLKLPTGTYTFTIYGNEGSENYIHLCASGYGNGFNGAAYFDVAQKATVTVLDGSKPWNYVFFRIFAGGTFDVTLTIQVESGSESTPYSPYVGTTYPIPLGTTVYGGTLDVLTGVLTVTDANIAGYNGETLPSTWISDRDVYVEGAIPTTGAQVVYKLATPIEVDLTQTEITTLLGTNNIFADCGDTTVDYYADPTLYINKKIAAAVAALS